jgi:hypothetical protein
MGYSHIPQRPYVPGDPIRRKIAGNEVLQERFAGLLALAQSRGFLMLDAALPTINHFAIVKRGGTGSNPRKQKGFAQPCGARSTPN